MYTDRAMLRAMLHPLGHDYSDALCAEIARRGYHSLPVYGDGNAIYINFATRDIYATPGFEGDWNGLPIETRSDDDEQEFDILDVSFTGDLARDYDLWCEAIDKYLADDTPDLPSIVIGN